MKQKVIEYFDTYFSNFDGELNESTSDEQLEEAAMALVNLTEEVLQLVESIFMKAANFSQAKVQKKNLKRSIFNPLTKSGRQRNLNRKVLSQTDAGKETLAGVDSGEYKKAKKELKAEIRKSPEGTMRKIKRDGSPEASSELKRGLKYGKSQTITDLKRDAKLAQSAHTAKQQVAGKPLEVKHSGLSGVPSQAPKSRQSKIKNINWKKGLKRAGIGAGVALGAAGLGIGLAHMNEESNNNEEENKTSYQDHEKMRISQKLLNVANQEDWRSREKKSSEVRNNKKRGNKKHFDNIITKIAVKNQPHAQKSLVSVSGRKAIPVTNQGLGQTTAVSNMKAMMDVDGISDSLLGGLNAIKKNITTGKTKPETGEHQAKSLLNMAKKEKKKKLRHGQEEKGQGRLF